MGKESDFLLCDGSAEKNVFATLFGQETKEQQQLFVFGGVSVWREVAKMGDLLEGLPTTSFGEDEEGREKKNRDSVYGA